MLNIILIVSMLSLPNRGLISGQPSIKFEMSADATGFTTQYGSYPTGGYCIHLGLSNKPGYRWSCHYPLDTIQLQVRQQVRACQNTNCTPYALEQAVTCTCAAPYTGCLDNLYPQPLPLTPSLVATAFSQSQINLTITDDSCNTSQYFIERSSDGGVTWQQIAVVPVAHTP